MSNLDGPSFVFQNTSGTAITNAVFTIFAGNGVSATDSFNAGTIAAGANFVLEVGITDDGGSGHTFFKATGSILDTSDVGSNSNSVQFEFTGLQGSVHISSGIFTPATSVTPSNDGTVAAINFLGGPGNADGPCNDCYGPHVIAKLQTAVPEPSSWLLASMGLVGALAYARRARR